MEAVARLTISLESDRETNTKVALFDHNRCQHGKEQAQYRSNYFVFVLD